MNKLRFSSQLKPVRHLNTLHLSLYLMSTVFLLDVLVPCSSESDVFESLDGLSCPEVAVGAEVTESELAHMLTLAA